MLPRPAVAAALLAATAIAFLGAAPARAQEGDGWRDDGAYGRLDGDMELRADAGAALAAGGPALAAGAAAVYLSTAGVYTQYTDAFGGEAAVSRSIAAGVHLQPLFLGRYASDLEHGPPRLDLLLDSVALGVGAVWSAPRGAGLQPDPGLELALSLSIPVLPDATGPFVSLRGALRWRAGDLAGGGGDVIEQGALLSLSLAWHHVIGVHAVDAGDGLTRDAATRPRGEKNPPRLPASL